MTTRSRTAEKKLWLISVAIIVAILAVNYVVSGPSRAGSPVVVRLAAAAIVTACAAVAKVVGGPRAAAATAVVGVLIAVLVLSRLG